MPRPDSLQTLAFRIAPETISLPYPFYMLTVPEHWRSALLGLQAARKGRERERSTVPHRRLSELLRALMPDLLFVDSNNQAWRSGEASPWLFAQEPTNTEALYLIVRAWIQTVFADAPEAMRSNWLSGLQATDLRWQRQSIDLATWGTVANGTAAPDSPNSFRLLPNLLASRFSQDGVELHIGNEPIRFRRALLDPGESGVELISWPPRQHSWRGKTWPYSLVLTLSVQTVPFQTFPFVYCNLSVRRWAGPALNSKSLPSGNTSVYLLTEVPWIQGIHSHHSFQVAPVRWMRVPHADRKSDESAFQVVWANQLAELLDRLRPSHPLPRPQQLLDNPLAALNVGGSPNAAVVFRNGMEPQHQVGTGVPPADRKALAEQITHILRPEVLQSEPLPRLIFPVAKSSKPDPIIRNRMLVCCNVGEHVRIEIRHQTGAVRDALTQAVEAYFQLDRGTKFPYQCAETGLTIHLHTEPLGEIGSRLELPKGGTKQERLHAAIRQRCAQVAAKIAPASTPTGTLVELHSRHDFSKDVDQNVRGLVDPKAALRKAFAHTQWLTQFINTPNEESDRESLEHRAISSVRDLFRQLGVQEVLPGLPTPSRGSINYVGLWLVKEYASSSATRVQEKLPVMVHVQSETGRVLAIAGDMSEWLPYRELLLKVGRGEVKGVKEDKEALPFVKKMVSRDLSQDDTLLLCHSQNLRRTWPWLADKNLTLNELGFGDREIPQPISQWPGLRVIRIRDSDANETPQWYAANEDESVSYTKGLFSAGERVFMGLNEKDSKFQRSRHLSMFQGYTSREGASRSPAVAQYTPSRTLCEITAVCLQAGDEPAAWAALTNKLREVASHYDEATALPLPLHLAKQVKEYVLPVAEEEDEQT